MIFSRFRDAISFMMRKACLLLAISALFLTACTKAVSPTSSRAGNTPPDTPAATHAQNSQEPDLALPPPEPGSNKPPQLIWQRIAQNSAFTRLYDHPKVVAHTRDYLERERLLSVISKRSEPFIYFILSEIEQRDLPAELALLPFLESGYNPMARSRTLATGLWQFTAQTAEEFGLQRTCCYDARYDVYASTMAALDYLEELHALFDQDWMLALMAYNGGPNRLKSALRSGTQAARSGNYWELDVSPETREYVPKLLAFCSIVTDAHLNRTRLYPVANTPYLDILKSKKRLSADRLAHSADITLAELQALNPAMQHPQYPLPRGYHVLVPRHKTETVKLAMEILAEEPHWYKHKIASGESLSVIAVRYGTSVSALRRANKLNGSLILAGNTLIIPH